MATSRVQRRANPVISLTDSPRRPGSRIELGVRDGIVWEHAQEAAKRAESWMLECLEWVCSPCAPAVKVEVRSWWG